MLINIVCGKSKRQMNKTIYRVLDEATENKELEGVMAGGWSVLLC